MKPFLTLFAALSLALSASAPAMEKWVYLQTNLLVEENVTKAEALWQRAAAAGYTHVLLADSKFSRLAQMDPRYFRNIDRLKQLAAELKLEVVPAVFPIGYSNDLLSQDVNLIEALPVKDAPLIVRNGVAELDRDGAPELPGSDFTDLKKWSWKDSNVTADEGAARITDPKGELARIVQKLKVKPHRQYHVSVRIRTQDFKGTPEIKVLTPRGQLSWDNLRARPTQDWTTHHVVFNSQQETEVSLYLGAWPAQSGALWWDDAAIEEVAFLNLVRRDGAPLSIATSDGRKLEEGRDFEPLRDPLLGRDPWSGEYTVYHEPPQLKTSLPDGTRLLASYYHGVTVLEGQAMICPSEPKTVELLRDQVRRVHAAWGAKVYMMSHDEVRVLNHCKACRDRRLTPGQILADNVRTCTDILREVNPGGRIYVWSDMFDPNHNAIAGPYYLVKGDLRGSWEGLDKEVMILPWYFEKRNESLKFFAERGHQQVIAGYYDSRPERIADWLAAAKNAPDSVIGVMYTTWQSKYSDLEKFSELIDTAGKQ